MIKISLKAADADAWRLLRRLQYRPRNRIMFCKAVIDKLTTITGDLKTMIITDTQEVDLAIKPVDKKGNAAQVDGAPVWKSSNPDVATVTAAEDGLSCVVKAATQIGSAQISVSADADLGTGVETIAGTIDIDVVAGKAASLSVIAGTPREQT